MKRKVIGMIIGLGMAVSLLGGCASIGANYSDMKGSITGNTYTIDTFDSFGNLTIKTHGKNISMSPNKVKDVSYDSSKGWTKVETMSSVITITIDGNQMISCGDTCVFYEDGLKPVHKFDSALNIESENGANAMISGIVNDIKNDFGKKAVVIVKSQLGYPIYAFEGDKVNWDVKDDLPKTTRIWIDGKLLYIHRGDFQVIDTELLNR